MNREQVFVAFRKFVEQNKNYYVHGQTGIIEEVLSYFGLSMEKFVGAPKCVHENHLEILQDFLRNHASDEQAALVYDIATGGKRVPVVDVCCNGAGSVFVSMVMNEELYSDVDMIRKGIESAFPLREIQHIFLTKQHITTNIAKVMLKGDL